ncbi:MAG: pyruvate kinase, partial [Candidatus Margulisiibacteriota bacterium]
MQGTKIGSVNFTYRPGFDRSLVRCGLIPDRLAGDLLLENKRLAIIGHSASGKSTLAGSFAAQGLPVLSARDIVKGYIDTDRSLDDSFHWPLFRDMETALIPNSDREIKEYLESLRMAGKMWPPYLTASLLFDRLAQIESGWVLEGFSMDLNSAGLFLDYFPPDALIHLSVPEDLILERSLGRRKATDTPDVIRAKIRSVNENLSGVLDLFRARGLLLDIDASQEMSCVEASAKRGLYDYFTAKALSSVSSQAKFEAPLTNIMTLVHINMPETVVRDLIRQGIRTFRFNFAFFNSDAARADLTGFIRSARRIAQEELRLVGFAADLPGPNNRTAVDLKPLEVSEGQEVMFSMSNGGQDSDTVPISFQSEHPHEAILSAFQSSGQENPLLIYIDHAQIVLRVTDIQDDLITACVVKGGTIKGNKSASFPGTAILAGGITDDDMTNLRFALDNGFDYIIQSFVNSGQDVLALKTAMAGMGRQIPVIAKIETDLALMPDNLEDIARESSGLMVARGHLADELGIRYSVPAAQDAIIKQAQSLGKPVIVATEVYSSMMNEVVPNRPDMDNAHRAIIDQADMFMLSGAEMAISRHPLLVTQTLLRQIAYTESRLPESELYQLTSARRREWFLKTDPGQSKMLQKDIVEFALLNQIGVLVIRSDDPEFVRNVSGLRPNLKIIVLTGDDSMAKTLLL